MTTMITEVYDAFISAGADEDKSRKAAESIANYEADIKEVRSELRLIRFMLMIIITSVIPLNLAIFWKVFS